MLIFVLLSFSGSMKLATTKLVLLEVPNPKLPHLMSLTPLLSTRRITQQCLPGKFEIGYLVKAYALMIMCPALVRLTGKLTQIKCDIGSIALLSLFQNSHFT